RTTHFGTQLPLPGSQSCTSSSFCGTPTTRSAAPMFGVNTLNRRRRRAPGPPTHRSAAWSSQSVGVNEMRSYATDEPRVSVSSVRSGNSAAPTPRARSTRPTRRSPAPRGATLGRRGPGGSEARSPRRGRALHGPPVETSPRRIWFLRSRGEIRQHGQADARSLATQEAREQGTDRIRDPDVPRDRDLVRAALEGAQHGRGEDGRLQELPRRLLRHAGDHL